MNVFGLVFSSAIIDALATHAEEAYPIEACGIILSKKEDGTLVRAVQMKNVQDKYHARDPVAFPRDGRDAFRFDELERMRVLDAAEVEGLVERVVYHSHADAGAYFSAEDRAAAVVGGVELLPGVVHVVVSVQGGRRADMAAFRYVSERGVFEESRIPLGETHDLLPDLELRAMTDRRESARPIKPVGGALVSRQISDQERAEIARVAEKTQIRVDRDEALRDLDRLAFGLLSPVSGFMRSVELRSLEQSGRLLSGTQWRTPVTLEITAKKGTVLPSNGALVELVGPGGESRAAMGLTEVLRLDKETVRLAGPVYVYDSKRAGHAHDTRAELLRRGAKRVLAISTEAKRRIEAGALDRFDVILTPEPSGPRELEQVLSNRDPWLDAAMAQNQGATHIFTEDLVLQRAIADSLAIEPWHP